LGGWREALPKESDCQSSLSWSQWERGCFRVWSHSANPL